MDAIEWPACECDDLKFVCASEIICRLFCESITGRSHNNELSREARSVAWGSDAAARSGCLIESRLS